MTDYARPELLVTTDWVAEHGADDDVRLVEVDVDTSSYGEAHIAGAVGWNWETQLCDPVRRDILTRASFEDLLSSSGIGADTTIVFYGDNNNWFATYAL
jgi:thiosulfate/3-mercaptopyruvate sulfurtransferase